MYIFLISIFIQLGCIKLIYKISLIYAVVLFELPDQKSIKHATKGGTNIFSIVCICDQINAVLGSMRFFFQKHKVLLTPFFCTLLLTSGRPSTGECSQDIGSKKSGPTKNRKPEVALSINVGVFR